MEVTHAEGLKHNLKRTTCVQGRFNWINEVTIRRRRRLTHFPTFFQWGNAKHGVFKSLTSDKRRGILLFTVIHWKPVNDIPPRMPLDDGAGGGEGRTVTMSTAALLLL